MKILTSSLVGAAFICLALIFGTNVTNGQGGSLTSPSYEYEASPAYPFGRLNPAAPPETSEFAFLIGVFDCDDRIRNPQNGKWFEMQVIRRASFVLNGYAIQHSTWNPLFNTSNFRIYDAIENKWKVTFFRMPGYQSGVWEGSKQGDKILLGQGDEENGSRLTFFDIEPDAYSWNAVAVADGVETKNWEFTCRKRH